MKKQDYEAQIENVINNGYFMVAQKRQQEIGPKLKALVQDYMQIVEKNKHIFENYHKSFINDDIATNLSDNILFLSDGINKLEITEYDLDLIIDEDKQMTLLDFILAYKPHLSLKNFSLGGSYTKIGIKFLEKIFTNNDKEYIKYLNEIGFYGSPDLFLITINSKKVIDHLIENYEEYSNFCGIKFNLLIKDNDTKKYVLGQIQKGSYNIIKIDGTINYDKLLLILDHMDLTTKDLFNQITLNNNSFNILQIYLNNNILKNEEKLRNVILPYEVVEPLINKYFTAGDEEIKNKIKKCLENSYIDNNCLEKLDENTINKLKNSITLKIKDASPKDITFEDRLIELANVLKTGISTSDTIIKYILNNYINMYNTNISFAANEVETLILIKKNNPEFHIVDSNKGPNFDNQILHLILNDKTSLGYHGEDNYAALNHEITHALQYYCYNDNTPINFYKTLPNKLNITNDVASFCANIILKMDKFMSTLEIPKNNDDLKKLIFHISLNQFSYEREAIDIFDTFLCFTEHLAKLGFDKASYIEGHPYDYMKYAGYDFSELLADYKSIMCSNREDLKLFVQKNLSNDCITFIESFYNNMLENYISLYKHNNVEKITYENENHNTKTK